MSLDEIGAARKKESAQKGRTRGKARRGQRSYRNRVVGAGRKGRQVSRPRRERDVRKRLIIKGLLPSISNEDLTVRIKLKF